MFNNHKPNGKNPTTHYTFFPIKEELNSEEHGSYTSYGISARDDNDNEIAYVSDVSTEYEQVNRLSELCTQEQLDPSQLQDVVEDFLAEMSTL